MKWPRIRVRAMLAAIVADPYRKLIALGLAFGLWFLINLQIRSSIDRTLTLTWGASSSEGVDGQVNRLKVVLPTERVIGRRFLVGDAEVQNLRVRVSGSSFKVDALGDDPIDLQITSFTGLDWASRREVEFTAADIRPDVRALQGLNIEFLDHARVRLEVERVENQTLRLGIDENVAVEVADAETRRRLRFDTAEFQPPEAVVLGPAGAIARLRQPGDKPLVARVRPVGNSERQVAATVELALGKELGLQLDERPTVTFQLLPVLETFQFELPLLVDDKSLPAAQRGTYKPERDTLLVRVRVGGQLRTQLLAFEDHPRRQQWAAENLRLLVVLPKPEPGAAPKAELQQEARLMVLETAQLTVDHTERLLDEGVSVTLRRQ
ncbi:MAG: hypothetical protein JNL08_19845 [Planctomycetes bacterium]|nr:hypothetical protein [Planctomycetota bacterium]